MNDIIMETIGGRIYVDLLGIKRKLLEETTKEFSICLVPYKEAEAYLYAHGDSCLISEWKRIMKVRRLNMLRSNAINE